MTAIRPSAKTRSSEPSGTSGESVPRIAIVGAGPMGRLHARTVARLAKTEKSCVLATVIDRHRGRAEAVTEEFGGRAETNLEDALTAVDAVIVCVPTGEHSSLTKMILEGGCDVLVEKPLAATVAEGRLLAESARTCGRILQVGHIEWYNQGWRDAVDRVGVPKTIDVERLNPASDRGLDIDVVQDFMLHDLDWVTRLLGEEVIELKAQGRCVVHDKLDEAEAELTFRSGCRVTLRASRVYKERRRIARISGDKGSATADLLARRLEGASLQTRPGPDPLEAQCRDFLDSVESRVNPSADATVGVAALEIVERVRGAIEQSSGSSGHEDGSTLRG